MPSFEIVSRYTPKGAQAQSQGFARNDWLHILPGATDTGKTYTVAHAMANHERPTLVSSTTRLLPTIGVDCNSYSEYYLS